MKKRYIIQLPEPEQRTLLSQDEAYFDLIDEKSGSTRIRFHDYAEIFRRAGLYEHLFHRTLQCASPRKLVALLERVLTDCSMKMSDLRVLDLGAGNGMVGAELLSYGADQIVGVDILKEARDASVRDHPGVYDAYFSEDLDALPKTVEADLTQMRLNCLVCVAALGFGDIPPSVFLKGLSLTSSDAWIAFNLKDSFFGPGDKTGFSDLIRRLIFEGYIHVHHLEQYQHRLSVDGKPLYYYAFVCRKAKEVPLDFAEPR